MISFKSRPVNSGRLFYWRWTGSVGLCRFFICVLSAHSASAINFTDRELIDGPSRSTVSTIVTAAQGIGWDTSRDMLWTTAERAYATKSPGAEAWWNLYRWSVLFATREDDFTRRWIIAMNDAKAGHDALPRTFKLESRPLSFRMSAELQLLVCSSPAFSEEFFGTLSPLDFLPDTLAILQHIYAGDHKRFVDYENLAIAISIVYDLPPSPTWPHAQVSSSALPRKFPPPLEAFNYWSGANSEHRTLHDVSGLHAGELKFVVDSSATIEEMKWAAENVRLDLPTFRSAYDMVRYRWDRNQEGRLIWPAKTYELPEIRRQGGICIDQAYFAAMSGKAKGVPTLIFLGEGLDGRHAWFGYLGERKTWVLDAGRYADQKYVSGFAYDPQTWMTISDHELAFIAEGFRQSPAYFQSRLHSDFAGEFLRRGSYQQALKSARDAVALEKRNKDGWEQLIAAQRASNSDTKGIETTFRRAILAFRRYPDLEGEYLRRLCDSLRARGENSAADFEERKFAQRSEGDRRDITYKQAQDVLTRSFPEPVQKQIHIYEQLFANYGKGAGIDFYDQVVYFFVKHLVSIGQWETARGIAENARQTLRVEPGSQLDHELTALIKSLSETVTP